jgi:hypothetical protein|tara:strand:+ start:1997 stop:2386 length:390 start_codon:yes stop_codon:yes gene_type:complete
MNKRYNNIAPIGPARFIDSIIKGVSGGVAQIAADKKAAAEAGEEYKFGAGVSSFALGNAAGLSGQGPTVAAPPTEDSAPTLDPNSGIAGAAPPPVQPQNSSITPAPVFNPQAQQTMGTLFDPMAQQKGL